MPSSGLTFLRTPKNSSIRYTYQKRLPRQSRMSKHKRAPRLQYRMLQPRVSSHQEPKQPSVQLVRLGRAKLTDQYQAGLNRHSVGLNGLLLPHSRKEKSVKSGQPLKPHLRAKRGDRACLCAKARRELPTGGQGQALSLRI